MIEMHAIFLKIFFVDSFNSMIQFNLYRNIQHHILLEEMSFDHCVVKLQ